MVTRLAGESPCSRHEPFRLRAPPGDHVRECRARANVAPRTTAFESAKVTAVPALEDGDRFSDPACKSQRSAELRCEEWEPGFAGLDTLKDFDRLIVSPSVKMDETDLPLHLQRQWVVLQRHVQQA